MCSKIKSDILRFFIFCLCANIKVVISRGDSARNIPLRNKFKLHRTGAGNCVVNKVDLSQRTEIVTLSLIVTLTPVTIGRTDPSGVGVVRVGCVGEVLELAAVKSQRLRGGCANNDTVEGTFFKFQLAQLAPRRGIELVVESHDVIEGGLLERHIGVGGDSQQQAGTDLVNVCIARDFAGDGAADKNDTLANRLIAVLAAHRARRTIIIQLCFVLDGIVRCAIAKYTVRLIVIVINVDVHGASKALLCVNILRACHLGKFFAGVGIFFCSLRVPLLLGKFFEGVGICFCSLRVPLLLGLGHSILRDRMDRLLSGADGIAGALLLRTGGDQGGLLRARFRRQRCGGKQSRNQTHSHQTCQYPFFHFSFLLLSIFRAGNWLTGPVLISSPPVFSGTVPAVWGGLSRRKRDSLFQRCGYRPPPATRVRSDTATRSSVCCHRTPALASAAHF